MAADVLGRGVHDQVSSKGEGVAQIGGGKRIVDRYQDAEAVGQGGHCRDVGHGRGGVADRLEPDQARVLADRSRDGVQVGGVDRSRRDPRAAKESAGQTHHAAVHGSRHHELVAAAQL